MKIIITESERDYIISPLKEDDTVLKEKLLKVKRQRKGGTYKKCTTSKKDKFLKLEEIIRNNFKLSNEKIRGKIGVSKATFYRVYADKAKELKQLYKKQSLF